MWGTATSDFRPGGMHLRKRPIYAVASALTAIVLTVSPLAVHASSHREAPLIAEDPLADNTDLYAFTDPADASRVVLVANYVPFQSPSGGPNFYRFGDDVLYQIHVDNKGDATSHIDFQFQFHTTTVNPQTFLYNTGAITWDASSKSYVNWNRPQTYSVTMVNHDTGSTTVLGSNLLTPPNYVGTKSEGDAQAYHMLANRAIQHIGPDGAVKTFAGQRDDPFFVNLGGAFDLLNLSGLRTGGEDYLTGINVNSIVLSVPKSMVQNPNDPVIGVWATASRHATTVLSAGTKTESGSWVQVSRLGNPLVNELVIALAQKDTFNAIAPAQDASTVDVSRVTDPELAHLLNVFFNLGAPEHGRNDLVTVFLTGIKGINQAANLTRPGEELRLNLNTPVSHTDPNAVNSEGLLGGEADGFPNGRRLADDVTDIELQAVDGATCFLATPQCTPGAQPPGGLGDGITHNDVPYLTNFPYVADPHAP